MGKGVGGGGRAGKVGSVSIAGRSVNSLFNTSSASLRAGSFGYLRGGGKASKSTPVTLTRLPGGKLVGTDGRHRITVARERGQKSIRGVLRTMGPRGGTTSRQVKIKL